MTRQDTTKEIRDTLVVSVTMFNNLSMKQVLFYSLSMQTSQAWYIMATTLPKSFFFFTIKIFFFFFHKSFFFTKHVDLTVLNMKYYILA